MCPPRAAPPAADPCLSRAYSSSPKQKGGTVIAEAAVKLGSYLRMLLSPGECRPDRCRCGCERLHLHERRERRPRQLVVDGQPVPVVEILIFICAECSATWRVLPAFLARHLWRSWEVVEREILGQPRPASAPPVPRRTVQRWRARLAKVARVPVQVLAVAAGALRELALRVGAGASGRELLLAWGDGFGALAVLLHRLAPGIRLM